MAANDVKILVKNVYAPAESQQFVVVDSLQVRALKEMIATALPGKPQPKQQKLIFGGKICDDDDTLAKVLAGQNKDARDGDAAAGGDNAAPFVFHLMVSSGVPRSRPTTPVAPPEPQTQQNQPALTPAPAASPAPAQEPATTVDPRGSAAQHTSMHPAAQPAFPFMGFFGAAPASAANAAGAPAAAPHFGNHHHLFTQAILMQQQAMILSQIQYLQQLQAHHASATQATTTATPPPAQAAAPFAPFGDLGHHFGHHGNAMPPLAPAFGPNLHNNGHAGAYPGAFPGAHVPGGQDAGVEAPATAAAPLPAAEPRARGPIAQAFAEILPLFDIRLALKMAFMLFIIGQDTPTDRLVVLALMSFGAYLHITGILAKVYELLKRSRGAPEANADAEGEQGGANNANPNGTPNAQARLGAITRYLRISSDRGLVHDIRYFFTGLLLSLVPAWHPQPLHGDPAAPQRRAEPAMAEAAPELPLQGI